MNPSPKNLSDWTALLFKSVPSTMDVAKKIHSENPKSILAIFASEQWQGRGRSGSTWQQAGMENSNHSKSEDLELLKTTNFSLVLEDENDFPPMTLCIPTERIKIPFEWVSLAFGCALFDALKDWSLYLRTLAPHLPFVPFSGEQDLRIKWPNDLGLLKGPQEFLKMAGILVETSSKAGVVPHFYIGLGLNFFKHPEDIESADVMDWLFRYSTLAKAARKDVDKWLEQPSHRKQMLEGFLSRFQKEVESYLLSEKLPSQLKSLCIDRMLPKGTLISANKGMIRGPFVDLDLSGQLIVGGLREPINSGEVLVLSEQRKGSSTSPKPSFGLQNEDSKNPMRIALDFGNTRVHLSFSQDAKSGRANHSQHLDYENEALPETKKLQKQLKETLEYISLSKRGLLEIIYVKVSDPVKTKTFIESLQKLLKNLFPLLETRVAELSADAMLAQSQLQGQYAPAQMGADRALRFLYAKQKALHTHKTAAVFSLGTAFTAEVVSAEGDILESLIAPGLQTQLQSLHQNTHLLPDLSIQSARGEKMSKAEFDTESSILKGVLTQCVGAIQSCIQQYKIQSVSICGGNAELLLSYFDKDSVEIKSHLETEFLLTLPFPKMDFIPLPSRAHNLVKKEKTETPAPAEIVVPRPELKMEYFRKIGPRLENEGGGVGERFDKHLATEFKFLGRNAWLERIESGEVRIEHEAPRDPTKARSALVEVKPTYKLRGYDQIWFYQPPPPGNKVEMAQGIEVIFDDGDVIAFSKPPDLVVHSTGMHVHNTFMDLIRAKNLMGVFPTHRIDRETSGLLLCARDIKSRQKIALAFQEARMEKLYLAVTKNGQRELPDSFTNRAPIGPAVGSKIRLKLWVNTPEAQHAETRFLRLAKSEEYSLWACHPKTGRTNQIRIHLASLGAWIVGDKMYHPNEDVFCTYFEKGLTPFVLKEALFNRHLLHNTVIQGDSELELPFAAQPIVCPLTPDFCLFEGTAPLLHNANIPMQAAEQKLKLLEIFQQIIKKDDWHELKV